MGNMMNYCIMYDECQLALGCSERFISVKPTHSTCTCKIETDYSGVIQSLRKYTVVRCYTSEGCSYNMYICNVRIKTPY